MLSIQNLSKKFGNIEALKGIDLQVNKAEFFGLLGPNGAGKSTLMNIIVGYLHSDSGKVFLNEKVMSNSDVSLRNLIGYIPQEISLYQELTAYNNLKIFGRLYGLSEKLLEKKIDEILSLVQITDRKNDKVNTYSGGMKRRLNLAAGLLHDPALILCDEPTVGVDPQSRNAIFSMLQELHHQGKTIIYTTHYMEEAERLCNRLAIIDHGRIIAQGNLLELINLLNQKDTVKIQKTPFTIDKIGSLSSIGTITESEYYFEVLPGEGFTNNSKVLSHLETLEIPNQFIQISRATLEDVFLNLTGRSLRD